MEVRPNEAGVTTPRALGRIVLASLLALLVGLVVLPLGLSMAQTTSTIGFVNPSTSSSVVINDKDTPYTITSWIDNIPTNPYVEFVLKDSSNGNVVAGPFAGTATTGRADTYFYEWTVADSIPDGSYTLQAVLYSGFTGPGTGTVVDTADITVTTDQADGAPPLGNAAGPHANITYPTNGGDLGVGVASGQSAGRFLIEGVASGDARSIQGYYSTSPAGTDASFKSCGSATSLTGNDPHPFKIQCTTASGDFPLDVTAVAVVPRVPNTVPTLAITGAADGHSVDAYFQRPTTVTVDPETRGSSAVNTCQLFVATVADQQGRPILGANVDAHAQGPDDTLKFDVGGTYSDPNKAPDSGTHNAETGFECNAEGNGGAAGDAGTQGSHPVAAAPSRKHIETVAPGGTTPAGTDADGSWSFALYSTVTGTTQITVWADLDDDDQLCSTEAKDAASIGWGVAAPTPVAEDATVTSCTVADPSPSPSPSASASASGSPTTSASPSGSPTASPTTSASPTASPSASPTPEPEPNDNERDISLSLKHTKSGKLKASGRVTLEDPNDFAGCVDDVQVNVQRRKDGKWVTIKKDTTTPSGSYAVKMKDRKGKYRAVAVPTERAAGMERCLKATQGARHKH